MKEFVKKIYRWKISFVYYFNLGYSEFAVPIAVVEKLGIILAVLKVLFGISFSIRVDIGICLGCSVSLYVIGKLLVANNMTQYANKLANQYNPEMNLINQIAHKLGIK